MTYDRYEYDPPPQYIGDQSLVCAEKNNKKVKCDAHTNHYID